MDSDILKSVWRTVLILRGAVAAVTLVAVLDSMFGWDRVEFLELTHALIGHWEHWLQRLVMPLFEAIPLVPPPTPIALNMLVVFGTLVPFFIATILSLYKDGLIIRPSLYSIGLLVSLFILYGLKITIENPAILGLPVARIIAVAFTGLLAFVTFTVIRLGDNDWAVQYSYALVATIMFLGTLELLYWIPVLGNSLDWIVDESQALQR